MDALLIVFGYLIGLAVTVIVARKLRVAKQLDLGNEDDKSVIGLFLMFWPVFFFAILLIYLAKYLGRLATK